MPVFAEYFASVQLSLFAAVSASSVAFEEVAYSFGSYLLPVTYHLLIAVQGSVFVRLGLGVRLSAKVL